MNKLLGFYELKDSGLPTVSWEIFDKDVKMNPHILWTIRTAIFVGDDLNLPRCVGVPADKAYEFALSTARKIDNNGIVIYYPYFIADKSGTLNVFNDRVIIESVKDDLWNLVTDSKCDLTYIMTNEDKEYFGDKNFLTGDEIEEITSYVRNIRKMFRDDLLEGKSVLLEWSFAYRCNEKKQKEGNRYFVFYEARTV